MAYAHTETGRERARDRARRYRGRLRKLARRTRLLQQNTPRLAKLQISDIRLDFQPRENLVEETVQMYVDRLKRGDTLQPLRVRFDGTNYFLEDGFHRLEAARRMQLDTVEAEIVPGTLAEMEAEFRDYLKRLRTELRPKRGTR